MGSKEPWRRITNLFDAAQGVASVIEIGLLILGSVGGGRGAVRIEIGAVG